MGDIPKVINDIINDLQGLICAKDALLEQQRQLIEQQKGLIEQEQRKCSDLKQRCLNLEQNCLDLKAKCSDLEEKFSNSEKDVALINHQLQQLHISNNRSMFTWDKLWTCCPMLLAFPIVLLIRRN